MKIIGLDIAKSSVICCALSHRPLNPREYYRKSKFFKYQATTDGIKDLLNHKANLAILEPTGINYSKLWVEHLTNTGTEVRFVGHDKLKSYRKHLDLPDKDDKADALALACWGWDYLNIPRRFVKIKTPILARIQDLSLRLYFYTRLRNMLINRIKQDLAYEFPEMAGYSVKRKFLKDAPLFWRWLAGDKVNLKYERLLESSCGLGITDNTTINSQLLIDIWSQECNLETELQELIKNDCFIPYLKTFGLFKFGLKTSGIFLAQVYPFSKFMGDDGLPEIVREQGQNGLTKRYLSLRRFTKLIGLAPVRQWSGDSQFQYKSGNQTCRNVWRLWSFTTIEPENNRPKNQIGEKLEEILIKGRQQQQPGKKTRAKICEKAGKLLFYELCDRLIEKRQPPEN